MTASRAARLLAPAAVAIGLAGAVAATAAPSAAGADTQQQTCPLLGADPDTVTLTGPSVLWPPNHQLVGYTLTAAETPQEAGDGLPHGVTISYSVTVEDTTVGAGGPLHDPDAQPPAGTAQGDFSVPVHLQLRAERAGTGTGRTYRIDWMASFDGGPHMCASTDPGEHPFLVTVPHDSSA